ncbi:MAG: hypothetical protein ACD_65C00058G0006, partial [uncultured bacterium]
MKDYAELVSILENAGHPPFRASQVLHDVFKKGIADYSQMINLPQGLRDVLSEKVPVLSIEEKHVSITPDGSVRKILFRCKKDGKKIESVLMRFRDGRRTVCVSSQVGCAVKCVFCATGKMGFKRSLSYEEIADQVLYFVLDSEEEITNVVFMGMGEPFNNYENVLRACRHLNDSRGMNLGARNITLSTAGVIPGILQLIPEDLQVNLAISLHAPNQELRQELVPIAKKYPLIELMDALKEYTDKTHRRISYEYVMLAGVNDSLSLAHELGKLLKGRLCHVNLIPYNFTDKTKFRRSRDQKVEEFKRIVETYR